MKKLAFMALFIFLISCAPVSNANKTQTGTYCNPGQRNVDFCTADYTPVCGWFDSAKIQCIKYPCANTYSNSCNACKDEKVLYYTGGMCPK